MKKYPSEYHQKAVFSVLPAKKETLAHLVAQEIPNCTLKQAKSIIWNMRRVGLIYTNQGIVQKT